MLNVCVIGCGRAGRIHAKSYAGGVTGARLLAVCDPSEEARTSAAADFGAARTYADWHDVMADPDIDAVVVVTPTGMHRDIVVAAAAAGKHVFCEKPMASSEEECDEMIAACAQADVKLQIGFMRRFDSSFREAKRLVDSGAIGDLVQIHSNTRGPSKPRPWMYDIKQSNGILAEVNSHDIDAVRWMAGSDIDTLYAVAGNFRNPEAKEDYPDYYDSVLVNGTMKNGVHFCIDGAAYVQYGYDSKMELIGTKGKINVGRSDKEFVHCTTVENGMSTPFVNSWMTLFIDAYLAEDTSFVNAVLNDTPTEVSGYDGRMAVATVQAGNESIIEKAIKTVK
jgi:myo-inositol 2-dehydrogenase/D-chiro-inositol 1-dehydrogenase/scyllo-inositol 2-dehydrogenase (NAD+)